MVLLVIPMLLVSFVFFRAAREKGYPAGRFALFPLAVGGALMLAGALVGLAGRLMGASPDAVSRLSVLADVLALVVFFAVVAKAWKGIKVLPPSGGGRPG